MKPHSISFVKFTCVAANAQSNTKLGIRSKYGSISVTFVAALIWFPPFEFTIQLLRWNWFWPLLSRPRPPPLMQKIHLLAIFLVKLYYFFSAKEPTISWQMWVDLPLLKLYQLEEAFSKTFSSIHRMLHFIFQTSCFPNLFSMVPIERNGSLIFGVAFA